MEQPAERDRSDHSPNHRLCQRHYQPHFEIEKVTCRFARLIWASKRFRRLIQKNACGAKVPSKDVPPLQAKKEEHPGQQPPSGIDDVPPPCTFAVHPHTRNSTIPREVQFSPVCSSLNVKG